MRFQKSRILGILPELLEETLHCGLSLSARSADLDSGTRAGWRAGQALATFSLGTDTWSCHVMSRHITGKSYHGHLHRRSKPTGGHQVWGWRWSASAWASAAQMHPPQTYSQEVACLLHTAGNAGCRGENEAKGEALSRSHITPNPYSKQPVSFNGPSQEQSKTLGLF